MNDIPKVFGAISVVLFFFGLGFEYFRNKYKLVSELKPEEHKQIMNKDYLKKRKEVFVTGLLLSAFMALFFYLLLPTAVEVISKSQLELWHFNLVNSLFLFLTFLNILLLCVTSYLTVRIIFNPRKRFPWLFNEKS